MGIQDFREKYHLAPQTTKVALTSGILGVIVATTAIYTTFTRPQNIELERLRAQVKIQNELVDPATVPQTIEKIVSYSPVSKKDTVLTIPKELYLGQSNYERTVFSTADLSYYMIRDHILDNLAKSIVDMPDTEFFGAGRIPLPDYIKIKQFIDANVKYVPDEGYGYAKTPLETLVSGGGDCEDITILYSSLLRAVHRDVCLIKESKTLDLADLESFSEEEEQRKGHMTLAIALRGEERPISFRRALEPGQDEHVIDKPHDFPLFGRTYIVLQSASKDNRFFKDYVSPDAEYFPLP